MFFNNVAFTSVSSRAKIKNVYGHISKPSRFPDSPVVFVIGQGGAAFHSPDPALTPGRGCIFQVILTPAPSWAHPHLFREQDRFYHLFLTGTRLG